VTPFDQDGGLRPAILDLDFVRSLRARAARDASGLYAVEGVRFLIAAADAGASIEGIVMCEALLGSAAGQMIVRRSRRRGVPVLKVTEQVFGSLGRLTEGTGRGVIAVVRQRWCLPERVGDDELWLAIEGARSPGNIGTLLRTCLAVGARGVFALGDVDLHDPGCVRATMGALPALELARVSSAELGAIARRSRARIIGTSPLGTHDFRQASYARPAIIAVGCERKGLSGALQRACDVLVRIPMRGALDSLNLAVAGSLVLYEAFPIAQSARGLRRSP
jgi:TrmH family RNA methyltransferase